MIIIPPEDRRNQGVGELKKHLKKHLNKVVVVDVTVGLVIKAVRFMNGTPSTVSLKGIVPVMANTSGHLIQNG